MQKVCPENTLINLKVWMPLYLIYWQHGIVFLPTLIWRDVSYLPFSTDDLNIVTCHLLDHGPVSTPVPVIRTHCLSHIVTAAVGDHNVVRLAEEGAVSRRDQDSGARGPSQHGHSAVMLLVRAPSSQGADPGVPVSGLLVWRLRSDTRPINLRQNGAKNTSNILTCFSDIFCHYYLT